MVYCCGGGSNFGIDEVVFAHMREMIVALLAVMYVCMHICMHAYACMHVCMYVCMFKRIWPACIVFSYTHIVPLLRLHTIKASH